jgi:hypothetical protein
MMTKNNYVLTEGSDNTVWVSVQPLQHDVYKQIEYFSDLPTDHLSESEKETLNIKIIQLKGMYDFLDALLIENKINKIKDENTK